MPIVKSLLTSATILLAVAAFAVQSNNAKIALARSDLLTLNSALMQFRLDCDRYPTAKEGLKSLRLCQPGLEEKWRGPYIQSKAKGGIPLDPWRHAYVYETFKKHGTVRYSLKSYGADGKPGGTGENADIVISEK